MQTIQSVINMSLTSLNFMWQENQDLVEFWKIFCLKDEASSVSSYPVLWSSHTSISKSLFCLLQMDVILSSLTLFILHPSKVEKVFRLVESQTWKRKKKNNTLVTGENIQELYHDIS